MPNQFYFPKLVYKASDPLKTDNLQLGYTINTNWYNVLTDKLYTIVNASTGKWHLNLIVDPLKININSTSDIQICDPSYISFGGYANTDPTERIVPFLQSRVRLTRDATRATYNEFCERVEQSISINTNTTYADFASPTIFSHFTYGSLTLKDMYLTDSIYLLGDSRQSYLDDDFLKSRGIVFFRDKTFSKRSSITWDEDILRFVINTFDDTFPALNKSMKLLTEQDMIAGAAKLSVIDDQDEQWQLVFSNFDKQFKVYTPKGQAFNLATIVYSDRSPVETDYDEYYVGQTWINTVSNQEYVLVEKNDQTKKTIWQSDSFANNQELTNLSDNCEIQVYAPDKDKYYKMTLDTLIDYIKSGSVVPGNTVPTNSNFEVDGLGNLMPYTEMVNGLFELDGNGDLMPVDTLKIDQYFEIDSEGSIVPKSETDTGDITISSYNFYILLQNIGLIIEGAPDAYGIYEKTTGIPIKILTSHNLYVLPVMYYDPVNNHSRCGLGIINRDTLEYNLFPFGMPNHVSNTYISDGILSNSNAYFVVSNVIENTASTELTLIRFNCLTKQLVIVSSYTLPLKWVIVTELMVSGSNIYWTGTTNIVRNTSSDQISGIINIDTGKFTSNIYSFFTGAAFIPVHSEIIGDRIYSLVLHTGSGSPCETPILFSRIIDDNIGTTIKVLYFKQSSDSDGTEIRDVTSFCYDGEFIYATAFVNCADVFGCVIKIEPTTLTVDSIKRIHCTGTFNYPTAIKCHNSYFYIVLNVGLYSTVTNPPQYYNMYSRFVKVDKTFSITSSCSAWNPVSHQAGSNAIIVGFTINPDSSFCFDVITGGCNPLIKPTVGNLRVLWSRILDSQHRRYLVNLGSNLFNPMVYIFNPNRYISVFYSEPTFIVSFTTMPLDDPWVNNIFNGLPSTLSMTVDTDYIDVDPETTILNSSTLPIGSSTLVSNVISPTTPYSKFEYL